MKKKKFIISAKEVIDLEIKALQKLKSVIGSSFNEAVSQIAKCQSKVILCGQEKWFNRIKNFFYACISWYSII